MIISHKYKFIFLHCRKTGGSTITSLLNRFLGPNDIQIGSWPDTIASGGKINQNVLNILLLKAMRQPDFIPKLIKMLGQSNKKMLSKKVNIIVKEKYRKMISENPEHATAVDIKKFDPSSWEKYLKFCFVRNPFDAAVSDFYWSKGPQKGVTFEEFLLRKNDASRADPERLVTKPITNWEIYTLDDKVAVDFIGRFENMNDDLRQIGRLLNLECTLELPPWKAKGHSRKTPGLELYNEKTISLVGEIYDREIKQFNYSFAEFENLCAAKSL